MVVRDTGKRLLRQLNSRYIYGRYPLLHAIIALIQITMVSILIRKFNAYYANRPLLTTMITNAVLGGIADTVAQTLAAFKRRQRQRAAIDPDARPHRNKDDFFSIEIQDLDHDARKVPWPDVKPYAAPPPFDFERMVRFMAYPFIMAPLQLRWFAWLNSTFPIGAGKSTTNALRRVAFDQLIFAPCGLAAFFTFMTVAEGGGKRAVVKKFQDVYVPTLKANYIVWPAVQVINFRLMPIQFQIPFVSTVGIAWTAYLSLTNSAEDEVIMSPSP
ncbi:hypothetical protein EJ03DRAFT_25077 [Teratosphaeria nubilosa]|uniref:Uncharacterized protein n=1 Tax=Teratosphaeria nubilosa TaxID=161662 RepID=A0A6G1LH77_9PEZI|nr:hypothetical protein EJ03DRAFT_25077 [Teratosphaeria nubilosa]